MKQYNHFISLGYFCSVALDLERLGLRSTSSPFDWCISNIEGVFSLIQNNFEDFLTYENLSQNIEKHECYKDDKYNIEFFHDFDKYKSLKSELPKVKEKYNRRIERFYKDIVEPTLFIRYISDEKHNKDGKNVELLYIEENYDYIIGLLKSFNPNNSIIFIANEEVESDKIKIYHVKKDENDNVARKPIDKNHDLYTFLNSFELKNKNSNIIRYENKQKKQKQLIRRSYKKIYLKLQEIILKEYIHNKKY